MRAVLIVLPTNLPKRTPNRSSLTPQAPTNTSFPSAAGDGVREI
uniref:Uncharacterized protein n=1 Tax=Arundo donax TaxID=35708 RepID=A0A0A9B3H1_ARUDO